MRLILTGNPNSGKTSLFNELTGLNHKVGNYPGVTVDKKEGICKMSDGQSWQVLDIPGTYSLYPKSKDEQIAIDTLFDKDFARAGNVLVVVMDASNIKRSLFFCTQVLDLGLPTVAALTMQDIACKKGKAVMVQTLSKVLNIPIVPVNPRTKEGIEDLKKTILHTSKQKNQKRNLFFNPLPETSTSGPTENPYLALHLQYKQLMQDNKHIHPDLQKILTQEVKSRYAWIDEVLENKAEPLVQAAPEEIIKDKTAKADKILLHPVWGRLILLVVLLVFFQSVFWLASYPMDWIDGFFAWLVPSLTEVLPQTWWTDLLLNGVLAGLGGVLVFIPQIAILFFLITVLEDTGYMARISFLMDRMFERAGLSGKSAMPFISGMACAIPAIMAARTIENKNQRMLTILVTPFMSCSARLPVYAILIALVIPEQYYFGFISLQGLVLMGMYFLGFFTALIVSKVVAWFLKTKEKGFFLQELPVYQHPRWKNALVNMVDKSKIFVFNAGKIIMVISIAIWFLSSYGPSSKRSEVETKYEQLAQVQNGSLNAEQETQYNSDLLETSYIGILGKFIEPAIAPMGYDWKIGIALLASFAAREVFVGTMATIYAQEETEDNASLRQTMLAAKREDGSPIYDLATGLSLMVFYAYAMQCMATVATVKREGGGWKMALTQLLMMTGLAYFAATLVYQLLK